MCGRNDADDDTQDCGILGFNEQCSHNVPSLLTQCKRREGAEPFHQKESSTC